MKGGSLYHEGGRLTPGLNILPPHQAMKGDFGAEFQVEQLLYTGYSTGLLRLIHGRSHQP